jgi:outer membrane immunogenic protein
VKSIAIGLVAALALALPAAAADLIVDVPDVEEIVPAGFDWEGGYIGGNVGYAISFGDPIVGAELGYNFLVSESILLGIEGSGMLYADGSGDTEFFVRGKTGVAIDNVAIYGLAGVGIFNFGLPLWDIGAGVEVAVTDNVTLNGQVFLRGELGDVPDALFAQAGVRFHF